MYDNNDNVTKVGYSSSVISSVYNDHISYTYDSCDRVTKETRGSITTDYTYNMAGLVTGMTNKNGASVLSTYSNTYNYDGNVAKAVENGVTKNYTYDYMNRLKTETNSRASYTYDYDKAGNRIKLNCIEMEYEDYNTTYKYDKNNRLIEEVKNIPSSDELDITSYSYDKNGNQLTKVKSYAETIKSERQQSLSIKTASELSDKQSSEYFTYNVFNQLKGYRNTKGTKAVYKYLPNGYRYSKTVGSTTKGFLWDGDNVAGETDSKGNVTKMYFYGKDMLLDDSGNNYIYDIHGSVTSIVNSGGAKSAEYEYNAFGKDESETSTSTSNPWQYCGEYRDEESGLIYLRNRYYDCETGSFINEDPARSGINWYSYCNGNPVMFCDPLGLENIEKKLEIPAIKQSDEQICAITNLAMVIGYKSGLDGDWEQNILDVMVTPNRRQYIERVNYYIGVDDINKIYKNSQLNLGKNGKEVSIYEKNTDVGQKFDNKAYSVIKSEIDNDNPVIILYQGGSVGHFITVVGYREEDGEKYIIYNDTADGEQHEKNVKEMGVYDCGNNKAYFDSMYSAAKPQKNEEDDL